MIAFILDDDLEAAGDFCDQIRSLRADEPTA